MSGMQMPPQGGGQRPPDGGGSNPIEQNKSVFNPTDMASMVSSGQVQQGMTVKDLIEKVFRVPIDAPARALVDAVKKQAQTKDMPGKVQAMAQQGQGGAPPQRPGQPPARPAGPPRQGQGPAPRQGLEDLLK